MPEGPRSTEDTLAADERHESTLETIAPEPSSLGDDATIAAPERTPAPAPARPTLQPLAPRIGNYSILRKLGEGGMGVVYAGYDEKLDRKVAIKVLRGKAAGEGRKHRLVREAQGLARLSHPNVVQVYEIGEQGDDAFIAMEYVDGQTLADWLAEQPRSLAQTLEVFDAAGRGLAAAHQKGLVHRDFKPDNVMITREGRVLVMDFGLVHEAGDETEAQARVHKMFESAEVSIEQSLRISALSTDLTATGALMGTPAYMSPEQFIGRRTDARTDQFSFCVALWEALCGERPFAGDDFASLCFAVTQGKRREPPRGKLPRHVRVTLERGLAGQVEDRFADMPALLAELRKNPGRRRRLIALALTPVLLGLGAWQLWALDQQAAREQIAAACAAEGQVILQAWTPEVRASIAEGFHATALPYADDTWSRTETLLDAYASAWVQLREQACRARDLADEPRTETDPHDVITCLDEREAALRSYVDTLRSVDPDLVKAAIQTAAELPLLQSCVDAAELAQRVRPPDELREQISSLRRELRAIEVLMGTRPQQAREALSAADNGGPLLERALAIGWAPLEAEARYTLASLEYRLGNFAEARTELERAFYLAGSLGHDRLALDLALQLTETALKQEDFALTMMWAELADMFIVRLGLEQSNDAARLATARGNAFNNQGQVDEALRAHQRAREIWTAVFGPEHHQVATAWANAGIAQRKLGNYADALASMQESLRIRELALGTTHPRIAESIYNMGNVLRQQGKHDEALVMFERALEIWRTAFGPRHRTVAFALNNIGISHYNKRDFDTALEYFNQARDIWIEALGPKHSEVALALNNIGGVHYERKQYAEALVAFEEGIAIIAAAKGEMHPDLGLMIANVAGVHRERGDYDAALTACDRALQILEQAYGPDHPDVAAALLERGRALAARGDRAEARVVLERALTIADKRELAPLDRAKLEIELAELLWVDGERERALALGTAARGRCEGEEGAVLLAEIEAWLAGKP